MYCLLQIQASEMKNPYWIREEKYRDIVHILKKAEFLLNAVELFSYYIDAYEDMRRWCMGASTQAEYLLQNQHTSERKCRGVLLELKTYFLQMEATLTRLGGSDNQLHAVFTNAKENAKSNNAQLAFIMDLKECVNHSSEIVHTFMSSSQNDYLQPSCIPSKLLEDFNGWSKTSKRYLEAIDGNINLLELFESVYAELSKVQGRLVEHILAEDGLKEELLILRVFMDCYFSKDNCTCFSLAHMVYRNGKDAPKAAFYAYRQKKVIVEFNVRQIDWKKIYDLTDLLRR